MLRAQARLSHRRWLPDLELEIAVAANQFEVIPVGGDEGSAVRADRQSNQHFEVKIAQLMRFKAMIRANLRQNSARFNPVLFCRREYAVVALQGLEKYPVCFG